MLIAIIAIIAMAVGAVITATALVSLASVREDARWTLGEPAAGKIQKAARRILGYHSDTPRRARPRPRAGTPARLRKARRDGTPDPVPVTTGQTTADHDYAGCS